MFKKFIFSVLIVIAFTNCKQQATTNTSEIDTDVVDNSASANGEEKKENIPVFSPAEESFDFGTIKQGERVTHNFIFKNTGKSNLVISSAEGSCGCTVPNYPKNPIQPGNTDTIKVSFNSEGKMGIVEKTVTIITNAEPNTKVITIKANIIKP